MTTQQNQSARCKDSLRHHPHTTLSETRERCLCVVERTIPFGQHCTRPLSTPSRIQILGDALRSMYPSIIPNWPHRVLPTRMDAAASLWLISRGRRFRKGAFTMSGILHRQLRHFSSASDSRSIACSLSLEARNLVVLVGDRRTCFPAVTGPR